MVGRHTTISVGGALVLGKIGNKSVQFDNETLILTSLMCASRGEGG